jgi:hypothetical protein
MRARQLHSGFLLQLPDQQLEQQFWADEQTIKYAIQSPVLQQLLTLLMCIKYVSHNNVCLM